MGVAMQSPESLAGRRSGEAALAAAVVPALLAALLGAFILLGVGFAGADLLHSVAHDTRHGLAFPCH